MRSKLCNYIKRFIDRIALYEALLTSQLSSLINNFIKGISVLKNSKEFILTIFNYKTTNNKAISFYRGGILNES